MFSFFAAAGPVAPRVSYPPPALAAAPTPTKVWNDRHGAITIVPWSQWMKSRHRDEVVGNAIGWIVGRLVYAILGGLAGLSFYLWHCFQAGMPTGRGIVAAVAVGAAVMALAGKPILRGLMNLDHNDRPY